MRDISRVPESLDAVEHCFCLHFPPANSNAFFRATGVYIPPPRTEVLTPVRLQQLSKPIFSEVPRDALPHVMAGDSF